MNICSYKLSQHGAIFNTNLGSKKIFSGNFQSLMATGRRITNQGFVQESWTFARRVVATEAKRQTCEVGKKSFLFFAHSGVY
jgi:hypothetical protein